MSKSIGFLILFLLYLHNVNTCENGSYAPVPGNRSRFTHCANGIAYHKTCLKELHWCQKLLTCVNPNLTSYSSCSDYGSTVVTQTPIFKPIRKPRSIIFNNFVKQKSIGSSDFKVICYFMNDAFTREGDAKYSPTDINGKLCTHIIYAFAQLDPQTLKIASSNPGLDIKNELYKKVTAHHKFGVKISISLGGWVNSEATKYGPFLSNKTAQHIFINDVVEFIKKNNFDGLDLDLMVSSFGFFDH